jgi:hypothetical protein
MNGWNPDDDLADLLSDLGEGPPITVPDDLLRARASVPPEPGDGPVAGGELDGDHRRGAHHNGTGSDKAADPDPGVGEPKDFDADTAAAAAPPPAREPRPSTRPAGGAAKAADVVVTSAKLPEGLVEALTMRRLTAAADGGRFAINEFINEAVAKLPTHPGALAKELARYRDRLNVGLTRRDPGHKPTKVLSLRLTPEVDAALDRAVLELYRRDGTVVERQSLVGVAILRALG